MQIHKVSSSGAKHHQDSHHRSLLPYLEYIRATPVLKEVRILAEFLQKLHNDDPI